MNDPKGRVRSPFAGSTAVRAETGSFVLVPGPNRTILVLSVSVWEELTRRIDGSFGAESAVARCWRAVSHEARMDCSGRITLPATLRRHAGIRFRVSIIGRNGYLELLRPGDGR